MAALLKNGSNTFEPIIVWATDRDALLEILEGHLRATAYALAGKQAPQAISAIVGFAR